MGLYDKLDCKFVNYRFYHSLLLIFCSSYSTLRIKWIKKKNRQRETLTRFPVAVLLQHFNLGNLAFVNRASGQVVDAHQKTSIFVVLIGRVIHSVFLWHIYIYMYIYTYICYMYFIIQIYIFHCMKLLFEMYIIYDVWYNKYTGFFWYVIYIKYAICIRYVQFCSNVYIHMR